MSASREKKTRAGASGSQGQAHKEAESSRRKHILYGVAGGIVAVLAIALLVWDSGFFPETGHSRHHRRRELRPRCGAVLLPDRL